MGDAHRGKQHFFLETDVMGGCPPTRAGALADKRSFPVQSRSVVSHGDEIYRDYYSKTAGTRAQGVRAVYGSVSLDASNLDDCRGFFMAPDDPRLLSTLEAVNARIPAKGACSRTIWLSIQTASD